MPPEEPRKRRGGLFPQKLDRVLSHVTKPALKANGLAGSRIVTDWEKIVGPGIAKHATPAGVRFPAGKRIGGTLTVEVLGGYALEVQHLQPYILEKLASYFGYRAIERLQLTQVGKLRLEKVVTPPPLAKRVIEAQKKQTLEKEIAAVEDAELQAALKELEETVFD